MRSDSNFQSEWEQVGNSIPKEKRELSAQIAAHTEEFLRNGGRIRDCDNDDTRPELGRLMNAHEVAAFLGVDSIVVTRAGQRRRLWGRQFPSHTECAGHVKLWASADVLAFQRSLTHRRAS